MKTTGHANMLKLLQARAIAHKSGGQGKSLPAVPIQRSASDTGVIQRFIRFKDGTTLDESSSPDFSQNGDLWAMTTSPNAFLFKNTKDYTNLLENKTEGVEILTSHRHILGEEDHGNTRFEEAVADWGWGAVSVRESLSENELMRHVSGDKARTNPKTREYKSLPLEDTMVKSLGLLLMIREMTDGFIIIAGNGQEGYNKLAIGLVKASIPQSTWMANVIENLKAYYDASPNLLWQLWGTEPRPLVDRIGPAINKDALGDIMAMYTMLARQNEDSSTFILNEDTMIRALQRIDEIVAIFKALISETQQQLYVDHNVENAQSLSDMAPAREEHMGRKIGNAPVPSLVKVGLGHIARLSQQAIESARLYNSYEQFKSETAATEVYKRL